MKIIKEYYYRIATVFILPAQYLFTFVMALLGLVAVSFNAGRLIRGVMMFWGKGILRLMGKRLHVEGLEHIEPGKNYLLLCNHGSQYDIPALLSFYPRVSWLGRAHLARIPVFGALLRKTDYIPIKPGDIKETQKIIQRLIETSGSLTIAIFPEGTRTLDGNMKRFRKGFLYLLKDADLDILPVTLNGLYASKPKNRFWINLGVKMSAVVHPPVRRADIIDKSDREVLEEMKNLIESEYRGVHDTT